MKTLLVSLCYFLLIFSAAAQQAPNDNVTSLRGNNGQTYTFTTTGTQEGSLWGGANGIYTDDSRLGKAAVHAGLLKVGETGKVKVTILAGRSSYQGSTQHGITSTDYAAWSGSFQFANGQPQPQSTGAAAVAPANMTNYRGNNGSVYTFRMTGTNDGSVWGGGNGIYTDDSKLSTAAVHAGVLRVGQTADVKVTVVGEQTGYTGSTQNGIKTNDYGAWKGSYSFGGGAQVVKVAAAAAPANMTEYRGNNGSVYTFQVTGANSGSVWGGANGIYTDDSQLGAAAVQAGLVRVGETAVIKVKVLGGQASYQGTSKNGITSSDYGSWHGSYRFE